MVGFSIQHVMTDFRKQFQNLIENTHIFDMSDVSLAAWNNIHSLVCSNIPEKLFRYRGINPYSLQDVETGTISLCHAGMFPDKYDSYLYVDRNKIRSDLRDALQNALRIVCAQIAQKSPNIKAEKASQICYYQALGYTEDQIIDKILDEEYPDFIEQIESAVKGQESRFRNPRNSAKIGCFTESVQSKYMWDRYGDGYKGFALEYDFRECILEYNKQGLNVNLFPVIYADLRPDVTLDEGNIYVYEHFKQIGDKNMLDYLSSQLRINQVYWYRAYLYKDREEYEHEHEWRMLYYNLDNEKDYESIPDIGCLKAIYYGPDIPSKDKDKLHKIAVKRRLKEHQVSLDTESRNYALKVTPLE